MKITFLGTGTSMGVPIAGGFGRENPTSDSRDDRYRTSAWIQTEQTSIVIDTGPEFRLQTLRAGIRRIDLLLYTHEHNDHIAGLDDLRPYNYVQKNAIPAYSNLSCKLAIEHRYHYMFGPKKIPGSVKLDLNVISEPVQFQDCLITPLPVDHASVPVIGFRINDLTYITDAQYIPPETIELLKGSKLVVLNALQWEPKHRTHFTIPEAIEMAEIIGAPVTYLVHLSSRVNHQQISKKLPPHVKLAYDQLSVEI